MENKQAQHFPVVLSLRRLTHPFGMLRELNFFPFHLFFLPVLTHPLILLKEWLLLVLRESERERLSGEVHFWELKRNGSTVNGKSKTIKMSIL